jgi:hypothetical protein
MTSASIICSTPSSGRASSIAGKCQSTNTDTLECSVSVASKTCLAGRSRQKTSPIALRMTKIASPDRTGCDTGSTLGCQNNQLSPIKALPVASPRRGATTLAASMPLLGPRAVPQQQRAGIRSLPAASSSASSKSSSIATVKLVAASGFLCHLRPSKYRRPDMAAAAMSSNALVRSAMGNTKTPTALACACGFLTGCPTHATRLTLVIDVSRFTEPISRTQICVG